MQTSVVIDACRKDANMKTTALFPMLLAIVCCLLLAQEARAQAMTGYTSIDYYEDTNTVDAYSETDLDSDLVDDYSAKVSLTVVDQSSNIIANGSMVDTSYQGNAYVELLFSGTPDSTYTATGAHKVVANLWGYDGCYYRSCIFYWDNFNFTSFESQGIYQPWYYYFLSPGFQQFGRRSPVIAPGTTYDEDSVATPGSLTVTMSGAQSIKDGGTASFSVTASGDTPTNYQWTYRAPSGSGNSPSVTFNPTGVSNTATDGHWFANPNTACGASFDALYTIKCTVTFSNGKKKSAQTTLTVNAYWNPAGTTDVPTFTGYPTIAFDSSQNLYVVTGSGNVTRNLPTPTIYVPTSSQFHNKTVIHENKHVQQYDTGMCSDLYTVSGLMSVLSPLSDPTYNGLVAKINSATLSFYANQNSTLSGRKPAMETEAHGVSDPVDPKYLYQVCP
jgi:hypothetical protein